MSQIIDLLGWIFGAGGIVSLFMYYNATKRLKVAEADKLTAEARLAEATADKGVIDNYETMITRYEKYINTLDDRFQLQKKLFDQQIKLFQERLDITTNKVSDLEKQLAQSSTIVCYELDCKLRRTKE